MIADVFITISGYVLAVLVNLLPVSTGFPASVATAFTTLGSYVGVLDPIVPIDTLRTVLVLLVSIELIIFTFKTAKWLFSHVPLVGGRG